MNAQQSFPTGTLRIRKGVQVFRLFSAFSFGDDVGSATSFNRISTLNGVKGVKGVIAQKMKVYSFVYWT